MPITDTIEKPNSQTADRITASTIIPQQGNELLRTPRTIISERPAVEDINKIKGRVDEISVGMEAQRQRLAEAQPEVSVVDYLASQGQPSSFSERAKLAEQMGISNYTGTADQNTRLLAMLQARPPKKELTPEEKRIEEMKGAIGEETREKIEFPKSPTQDMEFRDANTDILYKYDEAAGWQPIKIGDTSISVDDGMEVVETPEQKFSKQLEDYANKIDEAYNTYTSDMNKLRAGDIPLTPEEEAQMSNINRIFDELKAQQLTANKNFEKGTEIAGIAAGRQRYAPEVHLGKVKQAVDDGLKKISELETKRLTTINDLKMAIRDKNYKQIGETYDRFMEYSAQKTEALKGVYELAAKERDRVDEIVAEQNKLIREELQRIQERKEDILEEATKNLATQETILAIQNAETIEEAIEMAGEYLQTGTGDIGEYLFYKRQRIANGLPYLDYKSFKQSMKEPTQTERDRALRYEALSEARKELEGEIKKPAVGVSVAPELEVKKYVPVDKYLSLRTDYASLIGDVDDFDDAFSYLLNPSDRKKYGIGYLKAEDYQSFGEILQQTKISLKSWKDELGFSRKEAEDQYKITEGVNQVPPLIEKILDEIYG